MVSSKWLLMLLLDVKVLLSGYTTLLLDVSVVRERERKRQVLLDVSVEREREESAGVVVVQRG